MSRCEGLATANGRSAASGRQSTRNKRCHRQPERKLPRSWRHADGGDGENGDLILSIPDTLISPLFLNHRIRARGERKSNFTVSPSPPSPAPTQAVRAMYLRKLAAQYV